MFVTPLDYGIVDRLAKDLCRLPPFPQLSPNIKSQSSVNKITIKANHINLKAYTCGRTLHTTVWERVYMAVSTISMNLAKYRSGKQTCVHQWRMRSQISLIEAQPTCTSGTRRWNPGRPLPTSATATPPQDREPEWWSQPIGWHALFNFGSTERTDVNDDCNGLRQYTWNSSKTVHKEGRQTFLHTLYYDLRVLYIHFYLTSFKKAILLLLQVLVHACRWSYMQIGIYIFAFTNDSKSPYFLTF